MAKEAGDKTRAPGMQDARNNTNCWDLATSSIIIMLNARFMWVVYWISSLTEMGRR